MICKLGLNTLASLDFGKVAAAWKQKLLVAIVDLNDRPDDKRKRVVTLQLELTPAEMVLGALDTVAATFQLATKLPPAHSQPNQMRISADSLTFASESPEDIKQGTIDEDIERGKRSDRPAD